MRRSPRRAKKPFMSTVAHRCLRTSMKLQMSNKTAISRAATIGIVIIIILVGAVAAYYVSTTGGASSTTTPTTGGTTTLPTTVTTSPTTSVSAYRSQIIIGTTDSVQTTLDPADAYDYFAQDVVILNVGDGLVDYKPGSSAYVPALATDWSVTPNGTVYTFNLRQGVKFADGTPFDATTVQYSVQREFAIQESAGPFVGAGVGGSGAQCCGVLNHTSVTGPYQVKFYLNEPFTAFLGMVAFQALWPVDPKIAPMPAHPSPGTNEGIVNYTSNCSTDPTPCNPNGLGPYKLTKWDRSAGKDVEMDFTANANYWNATNGWPKTHNIIIKFYSDSTSLALAMRNGEIDVAYRQIAPTDLASFQTNSAFKVWKGPGSFIQYLVLDLKDKALTQTVRQAIAYAMNRSAIANNVFLGTVQPLYSMIPAGMSYHTDQFQTNYGDANIAKAQALLTQAGYSTSHPLIINLTYPTGHYTSTDGIALQLKQALEKTGMVNVVTSSSPWSSYKASTQADQLQAYMYGWYPDYVDPYDYQVPFYPGDGTGFLHDNFVNSTLTTLFKSIASTASTSQLATLYNQAQTIEAQQAPVIPMFQGTSIAVSNTKVTGIVLDITIWFRLGLLQEAT